MALHFTQRQFMALQCTQRCTLSSLVGTSVRTKARWITHARHVWQGGGYLL